MKKYRFRANSSFVFLTSVFIAAGLVGSCTFQQPQPEPLRITQVSPLADTVETYPVFSLAFSVALEDSTVRFNLSPDPGLEGEYYTRINAARDTVQLIVRGMLQGRTTYRISLAQELRAQNGATFPQSEGLWQFTTHPREQEPNDDLSTADTIYAVQCGRMDRNDDIDWYIIGQNNFNAIIIRADTGPCGITLVDSRNTTVQSSALTAKGSAEIPLIDTLHIPDSLQAPLSFYITPVFAGSANHYQVNLARF